jgi:hypothetical protein
MSRGDVAALLTADSWSPRFWLAFFPGEYHNEKSRTTSGFIQFVQNPYTAYSHHHHPTTPLAYSGTQILVELLPAARSEASSSPAASAAESVDGY